MLFIVNVLLSIAGLGVLVVATLFAIGENYSLIGALIQLPLIAIPAVVFGALAYQRFHRRGVLFQSVVAIVGLQFAIMGHHFSTAIYGAFALLTQWFLGEFHAAKTPPARPKGAPEQMARVMWQRGAPMDAIRTALARRRMPAHEIERLVYELASVSPR